MLKRILKKTDKNVILSFLIPFTIFAIGSFCLNLIFDDKLLYVSDMKSQYSAFLSYYKDMVSSLSSFFYSFSKSIGSNMIGTVSYYLLSPLNFILLFFSERNLIDGILLLVILKISLSGLTMYLYLKDEFETKEWSLLLFSTCYALMGYSVNYYFNIMWLDAIYMMPLILIGINKIIKNERSLLYGVFLFFAIVSNYYMGYILCIFSSLYFLYKIINKYYGNANKDLILKLIIKFSIVSLLIGLMTSIVLIPTVNDLSNVNRNNMFVLNENSNLLNPYPILSKLYIGSQDFQNVLNATTPHLYVGMLMLPLFFFYFFNKNVKQKDKVLDGIFLLILSSGFFIPYINIIWHGFVEPNGFNYRYSYLVSFFIIYIGYKSFKKIKSISIIHYLLYLITFSIMSLFVYLQNLSYLNYQKIIISLLCTIIYIIILYILNNKNKDINKNKLIKKLLILLVFSELFFNFYMSLKEYPFSYKNEYYGYNEVFNNQVKKYSSKRNQFYRLEKDISYSYIDGMLYNYYGVSIFDSTLNGGIRNFFNNTGGAVLDRSIYYNGNTTEITDSLLGIKYLFLDQVNKENYNVIDKFAFSRYDDFLFGMFEKDILIYENPYSLSLGYMVNDDVKNFIQKVINSKIINNLQFQDIMFKTILNEDKTYLEHLEINKIDDTRYEIKVPKNQDFYLNIPFLISSLEGYFNLKINNKFMYQYTHKKSGMILVDNNYNQDILTIEFDIIGSGVEIYEPFAYYLNKANFEKGINELKKNQLIVEKLDNNYVKGSIKVTDDKTVMMTTIPYEKGWKILADGKKVDYYSVFDAFIAIDLMEGDHSIEMTFTPPGFRLGALISAIALIIFITYTCFENKILGFILNIYKKYEEVINYLIIGVLTTLISIFAYWFLVRIFHIDYYISTAISWFISVLFAYITNKIFVFKSNIIEKRALIKETYQFYQYRLLSLLIEIAIMFILIEIILVDDMVSKIITQVIVIILNYFFSKIFVFNKKEIQ